MFDSLCVSALQEMGWFDRDENSSGAIAGRLSTDAAHIRGAVADFAGMICQNMFTMIAAYAIAFSYNWKMTLVVTALLPLIAFGFVVQNKFMQQYGSQASLLDGLSDDDCLCSCCCIADHSGHVAVGQRLSHELLCRVWKLLLQSKVAPRCCGLVYAFGVSEV